MSAGTITWRDALRERVLAFVPQRAPQAAKKARAPKPIPVRDWIDVGGSGQPVRLLGFDQALVCVVIGLLALGIVMVYSATVGLPDSPRFADRKSVV